GLDRIVIVHEHDVLPVRRSSLQRAWAMGAASRSVGRQSLHAEEFLQVRAHRQIEARARWQRLLEPALVDRDNLAATGKAPERPLDDLRKLWIVLAEHECVVGV